MKNKDKSSDKAHSEPLQQCSVSRSFNPLSDNPNVNVYHWRKFVPENYNLEKDRTFETSNETYLGCFFFHRIKDQRVAQINVHETCIDVRIYYVEPFPHGVFQNIDWNDTTFLELAKNAGKTTIFEVCKIMIDKGYEFKSVRGFENKNKAINYKTEINNEVGVLF